MRGRLGHRAGLIIVGASLLGGGGCALLRATWSPQERLAWSPSRSFWYGCALVSVVVTLIGLRWLTAALGWGRRGSRTGAGTAMLGVSLKGIAGVRWLHAVVAGRGRRRRLRLSISCDLDADLWRLRTRLDHEAVARVRRVISGDKIPTVVRLHIRRGPTQP